MEPFSLVELATFIGISAGALSALVATMFKSRCDTVKCCWGGVECHRVVSPVEEPEVTNAPEQPQALATV
jgi:hypothetical protein